MQPETPEEADELFRSHVNTWNEDVKAAGGEFGAVSLQAVKICQRTIDDAGTCAEELKAACSAEEILCSIRRAKYSIESEEADRAARFGWRAGYEFAFAILKWQWEVDALRGEGVPRNSSKGGEARSKQYERSRILVLNEMKRLIENGHSISNAAKIAAKNGLGKSHEANRSVWKNHAEKYLGRCPPLPNNKRST